MRRLGKDGGGQFSCKSHPDITAVLKHDAISFRGEEWIAGRGPDAGQMLSALVLAYGRLCLNQRRRLMGYLLGELGRWMNEEPAPDRGEMVRNCIAAIQPAGGDGEKGDGPSPPPPPSSIEGPKVMGGHTVGRKIPKRGMDGRHRGTDRGAKGDKVRPESAG